MAQRCAKPPTLVPSSPVLSPSLSNLHAQARPRIPKRYRLVPRASAEIVGERLPRHSVDRVYVPPERLAASLTRHVPQSRGVIPDEDENKKAPCRTAVKYSKHRRLACYVIRREGGGGRQCS